ncbi:hypothetical protein J5N97_012509 [Dioscorea zingiberensis]|uniref:Uncharacterized protein n=1 Tax=Dioscorea zingiberensis TaxID=325984 RepID=A0A9D5CRM8_9LILI|nr:hypothetical protein J5N97_012509 [Dioscorea zingiberensis]
MPVFSNGPETSFCTMGPWAVVGQGTGFAVRRWAHEGPNNSKRVKGAGEVVEGRECVWGIPIVGKEGKKVCVDRSISGLQAPVDLVL